MTKTEKQDILDSIRYLANAATNPNGNLSVDDIQYCLDRVEELEAELKEATK